MRYAIDRYKVGTEEEVCADNYYGTYIPQRQSRFYCPECGEIVFWRKRSKRDPLDRFYHQKKTDRSPECDKRVDGRSDLYLYERIGLPLYLLSCEGRYQLNIGFPALGEQLLRCAESAHAKVIISGGLRSREAVIDHVNFYDSATTFLPINFIPNNGRNYSITIDSEIGVYGLQKKWSDYADGFENGGAIFSYEETGGKKIRRNDSISPGRKYYVISRRFSPWFSEIKAVVSGTIRLNDSEYNVYLMTIDISADNESRFKEIENYIKSQFGVGLLETAPELIVLWPPVVSQDGLIPVNNSAKVFCSAISGNAVPSVYRYEGSNVSQLLLKPQCGVYTVEIPLLSSATISVDRKYVGRELTFKKSTITSSTFRYEIQFENIDGKSILPESVYEKDVENDFFIKSNAKLDLYVGSRNKTWLCIPVRDSFKEIPARQYTQEFVFVIEKGVLAHYWVNAEVKESVFDENIAIASVRKYAKGPMIPIPRWAARFLSKCRIAGYERFVNEIRLNIHDGRMNVGILSFLASHLRGNK